MATEHQQIGRVVSLAYAAAAGRSEWRDFLEAYRVASGSAAATLHRWNRASGVNHLLATSMDAGEDAMREYAAYYRHLNPHFNRHPELMVPGNVTFGHRRVPIPELLRTEYHADYLRRFDLEGVMGACLAEEQGEVTQLCVLRPFRIGLYGVCDETRTRLLMPHAQRAVSLGARLATVRASQGAYVAALDAIADGVLLVDKTGRVLLANRAAARLFERGVLRHAAAGLETWDALLTVRLRRALRQVAVSVREHDTPPPPAIVMPDSNGTTSYRITMMPGTCPQGIHATGAGVAIVVVSERKHASHAAVLATKHGLTPRQTQVANLLVQGRPTTEIAAMLSTSVETVRTHVKHILRKTNQPRVTSLVRQWSRPAAS
jgi:DNA-binding CsgD family transcriptional regulator/PAS domain-containing protein